MTLAHSLTHSLIRTFGGQLVELKNGQTYNGHLVNCDSWMNINLREVVCTSREGDRFWKMPECYIRGNTIKYLCIPKEVMDKVPDEPAPRPAGTTMAHARDRERSGKRHL